jgi:hypothetical protein
MVRATVAVSLSLLFSLPTSTAQGQEGSYDPYESQFGRPDDVDIHDIAFNPELYNGKPVRVKGILERAVGTSEAYTLRSTWGERALLVPMNEIAAEFEDTARANLGEEFQVTGLAGMSSVTSSSAGNATIYIQIWRFNVRTRRERPGATGDLVTLETLVQKPGRHDGKIVRVVGQFRGGNLFGDLPAHSRLSTSDWVLKDELFAVWVSGKKPKGEGFELDTKMRRDAGRWLEVTGRPETVNGVVYLRANAVSLTSAKPPTLQQAVAPPPAPAQLAPRKPPMIVFTLPLDGERDVPSTGPLVVQFNHDMDEQTFRDRVVLRYAGARRVGDREFVGLRLSYDGGRRALVVDPGDVLRPGREVELILLPGIKDAEGRELEPRPDKPTAPGVAEIVRYRVAPALSVGR